MHSDNDNNGCCLCLTTMLMILQNHVVLPTNNNAHHKLDSDLSVFNDCKRLNERKIIMTRQSHVSRFSDHFLYKK